MVEFAIASLPHIKATLNYVAATGEKLVSYAYEPPAGVPMSNVQVEGHATTIHDLRPAASKFALDEVGFKLLTHRARSGISGTKRKSSASIIPNPSTS